MEEILFLWAKEHAEFKYQQGMNEILGIIMVCLASELVIKNKNNDPESIDSDEEDMDKNDDMIDTQSIFQYLHDPTFL